MKLQTKSDYGKLLYQLVEMGSEMTEDLKTACSDGRLDMEELKETFKDQHDLMTAAFHVNSIEDVYQEIDKDGDGTLDPDEVGRLVATVNAFKRRQATRKERREANKKKQKLLDWELKLARMGEECQASEELVKKMEEKQHQVLRDLQAHYTHTNDLLDKLCSQLWSVWHNARLP